MASLMPALSNRRSFPAWSADQVTTHAFAYHSENTSIAYHNIEC
jgi:hypothetical protein